MGDRNDPNTGSVQPDDPADSIDFGPDDDDPAERWDANDPRRQKDCFAPPTEPCECYCLHCNRVFSSDEIWLQRVIGGRDGFEGYWMCPTPNCGGAGFTFDIFPTDPDHPANANWVYDDDDDYGDDAFDEQGNYIEPEDRVYNPDEPKYKDLDENLPEDDNIEGEEWKYGLEPGEQLPVEETEAQKEARREWEEEQKRYDSPDERPRVIEWKEGEHFRDEDIPF
jgi:hypothetical protein